MIATFEAAEAIKILSGPLEALNRELIMVDVWDRTFRRLKIAGLLGKVDCPCCQRRDFEWLDGAPGLADDDPVRPQRRAGRHAPRRAARTSPRWPAGSPRWARSGTTRFLLQFAAEGHEFTVFPDGRAIIKGTNDIAKARTLYAKYVGV